MDHSLIAQQAELERLGFQILQSEQDKLVASRRSFYWDCAFTNMNYTVFVQRVSTLSADRIVSDRTSLIAESKQVNLSPLPRGMQSGNAILAVYIADHVDQEAQDLCERQGKKGFAEFFVPAALDLSRNAPFSIQTTPAWGALYYPKFRYILSRLLSPKGTPNQEPKSTFGVVLTVMCGFFAILGVLLGIIAISMG